MAQITVKVPQGFPVGTTLKVYVDRVGDIVPQGTPVSTAVIASDSTVTLTGLTVGIVYQVGAVIGGTWRSFMVEVPDPPDDVLDPAPTINTGTFLQSSDGVDPRTIPNQSLPIDSMIATRGIYADPVGGNIYHLSSYVENTDGRATVAVAGHAKGQNVWGANFGTFAYNNVDASAKAISCEIGGGILSPAGGQCTLLMLKSSGGNVGGGANTSGAFLLMAALASSQIPYGIRVDTDNQLFSTAFISAPSIVTGIGIDLSSSTFTTSAIKLTSVTAPFGIEYNGANFSTAAMRLSATAPRGIDFNGGTFSSAAIRISPTSAGRGIDFTGGVFTDVAIFLDNGHNIGFGGAAGTQIGTSIAQKFGFWGAAPTAKPAAIAGSRAGNAALADLLTKLATIGLITDGSTA